MFEFTKQTNIMLFIYLINNQIIAVFVKNDFD